MKITYERIKDTIKDGCALIVVCADKKYIYTLYGRGDILKLACEQAMIEDPAFNSLIKKSWIAYQMKIINN